MRRIPVPLAPRALRWLGVLVVVAVIAHFSLVTVPPEPAEPGRFWDKQLHFVAYAAFTAALAYATVGRRDDPRRRAVAVVGAALLFGAAIEVCQGALAHRSFGWGDLLANALGAGLGALWLLAERRVRYVELLASPGGE